MYRLCQEGEQIAEHILCYYEGLSSFLELETKKLGTDSSPSLGYGTWSKGQDCKRCSKKGEGVPQ